MADQDHHHRTRSQTKKAREAASGAPTPFVPPASLAGAFDNEADSAAEAAAAGAAAVRRTPRQAGQRQPRLASGDTNTNRNAAGAASGTGGRSLKTLARQQRSAARSGTTSEQDGAAAAAPEDGSNADTANAADTPAKITRIRHHYLLQEHNPDHFLDWSYAVCDSDVNQLTANGKPVLTLDRAKNYDGGRHANMTAFVPAIEDKKERRNEQKNVCISWERYLKYPDGRAMAKGNVERHLREVVAARGQLTPAQLHVARLLAAEGSVPAEKAVEAEDARRAAAAAAADAAGAIMPVAGIGGAPVIGAPGPGVVGPGGMFAGMIAAPVGGGGAAARAATTQAGLQSMQAVSTDFERLGSTLSNNMARMLSEYLKGELEMERMKLGAANG